MAFGIAAVVPHGLHALRAHQRQHRGCGRELRLAAFAARQLLHERQIFQGQGVHRHGDEATRQNERIAEFFIKQSGELPRDRLDRSALQNRFSHFVAECQRFPPGMIANFCHIVEIAFPLTPLRAYPNRLLFQRIHSPQDHEVRLRGLRHQPANPRFVVLRRMDSLPIRIRLQVEECGAHSASGET